MSRLVEWDIFQRTMQSMSSAVDCNFNLSTLLLDNPCNSCLDCDSIDHVDGNGVSSCVNKFLHLVNVTSGAVHNVTLLKDLEGRGLANAQQSTCGENDLGILGFLLPIGNNDAA